ncbi:MAG: TonB-dependent receptor [Hyphomicrobium sp.]|nr:TonB-dependent receptor [Hyphomicrobium sp.]
MAAKMSSVRAGSRAPHRSAGALVTGALAFVVVLIAVLLSAVPASAQGGGGGGGGGGGSGGPVEVLPLDAYTVVNFGLAQDIKGTSAELFGRVENVFDADYEESFGFNQPGRTFYGGVRAKF